MFTGIEVYVIVLNVLLPVLILIPSIYHSRPMQYIAESVSYQHTCVRLDYGLKRLRSSYTISAYEDANRRDHGYDTRIKYNLARKLAEEVSEYAIYTKSTQLDIPDNTVIHSLEVMVGVRR